MELCSVPQLILRGRRQQRKWDLLTTPLVEHCNLEFSIRDVLMNIIDSYLSIPRSKMRGGFTTLSLSCLGTCFGFYFSPFATFGLPTFVGVLHGFILAVGKKRGLGKTPWAELSQKDALVTIVTHVMDLISSVLTFSHSSSTLRMADHICIL